MAPGKKHSTPKPTGKGTGRTQSGTPASPAPNPAPNWPVFQPRMPFEDLRLTTRLEGQIVVVRNFWTAALCRKYVSFLAALPLITTPGLPKRGEALRVNDRFQIDDAAFANRLWVETGLRELVTGRDEDGQPLEDDDMTPAQRLALWDGEPVGLNPSVRIYRYTKGQFFDCHYDESNLITVPTSAGAKTPARTTWTMLLYLTSPATGCMGGETVFYPDEESFSGSKGSGEKELVVELETGMLLLHKHGNDCMLHEGREVTAGEKWVIRSDLAVRR